jgi:aspartyl-tRNA(Asn)/glutamyl-tRNA(Gln) amidotransferase subunit A
MRSFVNEFLKLEKPKGYYEELVSEISMLNKEYHAFTNINSKMIDCAEGSIPFSSKANICVKGFETTAGSKMLKGYIPPFDATAVERMLGSGSFSFLGETNMDEFGFGTFGLNTETPARNAFGREYVAGGSSSGAAVATALLKYHVALSESTGGSISTPAALNGVVGFTPTYGTISRYGLIDYANSLDKIGVMARSSGDARIAFDIVRGKDRYDTTCSVEKINGNKKTKLFVVKELMEKTEKRVKASFSSLLDKLSSDYEIREISSEILSKSIAPYYIIAMAEASTNLAKYDGYKYGLQYEGYNKRYNDFFTEARSSFGDEAKRRIILGTFIRSESVKAKYYTKALRIRALIIKEMSRILHEGFIISPTIPIPTPKISEAASLTPLENYAIDIFTIPPNIGGFPHITFPYGYMDGMPLGAQIITEQANDYAVLDFVSDWEEEFEYRYKHDVGSL